MYFLYSFTVTFGRQAPADEPARAVAWNLALFAFFALHHSVFARDPVRRWVSRHAPAGSERSVFVWVASLLFIGVCAWWQPVPGPALWDLQGPARWLIRTVQLSGIVLAVGSAAFIGVWELSGVAPDASHGAAPTPAGDIRAVGPYRWVRHPIYAGWFLIVFAATPMTMTHFVFAMTSGVYTLIGIAFEERSLRARTGGAYDRYARVVRWRMIPGVY
jgi:protein-S-isoprenylcysteine O-methyltransferase Ste14